jgi:hypothetical protein
VPGKPDQCRSPSADCPTRLPAPACRGRFVHVGCRTKKVSR